MTKEDILISKNPQRLPFDWGELTWFASGAQNNCDALTLGRCVLKPGESNPRHYHPNCAEILVVFKGKIRHTGPGGEPVEMEEGDTVTVPPNVWHNAVNIGDTEAVLIIAFTSAHRETVGE
jgi:quercetin dioxygenase-like cupin family protein